VNKICPFCIILPVVLYRCETWSLKLREEHTLREFENRMLEKIAQYGASKPAIFTKYNYNDKIKNDGMDRACNTHGEEVECIQGLVGKPEGRRRHRWEDNIMMDGRERGWGGMDWIHLAQDRDQWRALVNTAINLQVS
jgi:hypothetical protein